MSMTGFMDNINRELEEDVKKMLKELWKKIQKGYKESVIFHITQNDLEEANKIEEFAKTTAVGYDIKALESYKRDFWTRVVSESEISDVKKTEVYSGLILLCSKLAEVFTIEYIVSFKDEDVEWYMSADFHKRCVYEKACELCLYKKNITLNTAIKHVIRKEQEGVPAYLQIIKNEEVISAFIEELKKWGIFIKENDKKILCLF